MAIIVASAIITGARAADAPEKPLTILLIGDSTVTDSAGWGKAFADRFNDKVKVKNYAIQGRSSKSWYNEGHLPKALKAKPDYVFIQFGHNDQPGKGADRETDPATTYRDYLKIYVKECAAIGAKPIIVSPVTRRTFDKSGKIKSTLTPWAEAAQAVAKEVKVPFIDLHAASTNYFNEIGREASMSREPGMTLSPIPGDPTHFNRKGAEAVTDLIIKELKTACGDLAQYLK